MRADARNSTTAPAADDPWADILRQASRHADDGPEVVAYAQSIGMDPDAFTGVIFGPEGEHRAFLLFGDWATDDDWHVVSAAGHQRRRARRGAPISLGEIG